MKCIKKINLLLLLMAGTICFAQNRKVELEITGAKTYKDLYIRARTINGDRIDFAGETANGSLWIFIIPDLVVEKTIDFEFKGQTQKENRIGFLDVIQEDTLIGRYVHFENDEQLIRLKAAYHHSAHEVNYQYIPDLKKTVALQEWDSDYILIDPKWDARKINLNDENDINSLYSIIQNKNTIN